MNNPFDLIEERLHRIEALIVKLSKKSTISINGHQKYFHISEVVEMYELSRATLYNYHKKGIITLKKFAGKTYVSMEDIENGMLDKKR